MAATYTLISSQVLATTASSVTFSSIPQTYTDLLVKYSVRTDNAGSISDNFNMRFNGVSTTGVYSETTLRGTGSASGSNTVANTETSLGGSGWFFLATAAGATANTFSSGELYIPNYASTSAKQVTASNATETNGSTAYISQVAGLINTSSAISSLSFLMGISSNGTNFVAGSSFYLYGIKNA